jgi:transposase
MKQYIGLDISMKFTAICAIDQDGKILMETTCPTNPECIYRAIQHVNLQNIHKMCLETGTLSHYLCEELQAKGLPIICVDARRASAFLSLKYNKTDRNDAKGLAEGLRLGFFNAIRTKNKSDLSLNTLLRSRRLLVDQRKQLQQAIRGHVKCYGLEIKAQTGLAFYRVASEVVSFLPEIATKALLALLDAYEKIHDSIKNLEKEIKKLCVDDVEQLMTIPGIGPITALTFKAEIGDPKRFTKSRSVGAYVGMTPRQSSSGETERMGRISKMGPHTLRSLLTEAGMVVLTRAHLWTDLKAWGLKIQRKHGTKKAAIAVGRKLATIMHQMLLKGSDWMPSRKKEAKRQALSA